MKVGLIDVDGHNWPNLCLMKLSAYHKAQGDTVGWWRPAGWYDIVYKSRVFTDTYSKDNIYVPMLPRLSVAGPATAQGQTYRSLWNIAARTTPSIRSSKILPTAF